MFLLVPSLSWTCFSKSGGLKNGVRAILVGTWHGLSSSSFLRLFEASRNPVLMSAFFPHSTIGDLLITFILSFRVCVIPTWTLTNHSHTLQTSDTSSWPKLLRLKETNCSPRRSSPNQCKSHIDPTKTFWPVSERNSLKLLHSTPRTMSSTPTDQARMPHWRISIMPSKMHIRSLKSSLTGQRATHERPLLCMVKETWVCSLQFVRDETDIKTSWRTQSLRGGIEDRPYQRPSKIRSNFDQEGNG